MIRWEPVKGESQGLAVFDHGTKREHRIVLNSKEDFDFISRWGDRCGDQGEARGYLDSAHNMSRYAQEKTGIKRGER